MSRNLIIGEPAHGPDVDRLENFIHTVDTLTEARPRLRRARLVEPVARMETVDGEVVFVSPWVVERPGDAS